MAYLRGVVRKAQCVRCLSTGSANNADQMVAALLGATTALGQAQALRSLCLQLQQSSDAVPTEAPLLDNTAPRANGIARAGIHARVFDHASTRVSSEQSPTGERASSTL